MFVALSLPVLWFHFYSNYFLFLFRVLVVEVVFTAWINRVTVLGFKIVSEVSNAEEEQDWPYDLERHREPVQESAQKTECRKNVDQVAPEPENADKVSADESG